MAVRLHQTVSSTRGSFRPYNLPVNELVTPPLDGMILPGVTRDSVLTLAREHASGKTPLDGMPEGKLVVSERPVTMKEVKEAAEKGQLVEFFGTGEPALREDGSASLSCLPRYRCCDQPCRSYRLPGGGPPHPRWPRRHGARITSYLEAAGRYPDRQDCSPLERARRVILHHVNYSSLYSRCCENISGYYCSILAGVSFATVRTGVPSAV